MKAAIARDKRIVCDEIPDLAPAEGQVLVRTLACGICGSDLHALHHADAVAGLYRTVGVQNALDPSRDIVFGHEFCAEILDHGPNTQIGSGQARAPPPRTRRSAHKSSSSAYACRRITSSPRSRSPRNSISASVTPTRRGNSPPPCRRARAGF